MGHGVGDEAKRENMEKRQGLGERCIIEVHCILNSKDIECLNL